MLCPQPVPSPFFAVSFRAARHLPQVKQTHTHCLPASLGYLVACTPCVDHIRSTNRHLARRWSASSLALIPFIQLPLSPYCAVNKGLEAPAGQVSSVRTKCRVYRCVCPSSFAAFDHTTQAFNVPHPCSPQPFFPQLRSTLLITPFPLPHFSSSYHRRLRSLHACTSACSLLLCSVCLL